MTTVVIIVYNRLDNILHWKRCLAKCPPCRVVVIHNTDTPDERYNIGDLYIPRPNIGYDIGAFADVCQGRIDIGEWDRMLWVADDCFPMATDFIAKFEAQYTTGVTCMKISPYVRTHIRTTGFMIDKATAQSLVFKPIKTKQDCYLFEHRDPVNHFLAQVQRLGLPVTQVAPDTISPLWDIGYHRKVDRLAEHTALFGAPPLPTEIEQKETVTIICPIYHSFPAIISSLIMQTNPNWRLWLVHDGYDDGDVQEDVTRLNDRRIVFDYTDTHRGYWGHSIRAEWLQKVTSKYVMITNPDNYYAPRFIELALNTFAGKTRYVGAYCAQMAHSYKQWEVLQCRMQRGYIDCGGVMLKTEAAKAVGWNNTTDHSADWLFFADIIAKFGAQNFVPFKGLHFIHN